MPSSLARHHIRESCNAIFFSQASYTCRGLDTTYAKGWLIMVGASRTSPVPGNGMRRRHARRRILPSFGALRGDNTPTAALRGLRMITKAQVIQWCSLSCVLEAEGGKASSLPALGEWLVLMGWEPFAWVPWGVYIGLPPGGTIVIRLGAGPSRLSLRLPSSPPTAGAHRLAWRGVYGPCPPRAGLAGC